jgi:glycosyltransferase involved in cell wall biosynthesis
VVHERGKVDKVAKKSKNLKLLSNIMVRLRILQISPRLPYPPDSGGSIGIYNITKHLALRGHKITLAALVNELKQVPELEKHCQLKQIRVNIDLPKYKIFSNMFSRTPYTISKYQSSLAREILLNLVDQDKFDIVYLDHLHTAYYGEAIKRSYHLPIVLREHNVETRIMERLYRNATNPIIRFWAYVQYRKLRAYEIHMCEMFDKCLMTTYVDEKWIKEANPKINTSIIPAGVDTTFFHPLEVEEDPYSILFIASMDWLPNVDGFLWFYKEIFPLILRYEQRTKLVVIGQNPPKMIRKLASENVIIIGYVKDVRPYIAKASLLVVPLRIASGIRIKILNAFAMGKAVVSTSIGCEGIEVKHKEQLCIADTKEAFAESVIALMNDPVERKRLGEAGRALIHAKYRWEHIVERLENILLEIVNGYNP